MYITEYYRNRVRKVDATTNIISTVAGGGPNSIGDGFPGISAQLNLPIGLAVDRASNLYIADSGNHRIRKLDLKTGIITTAAGNGAQGFSGDGGVATNAQLNTPGTVAVGSDGTVYIGDTSNRRIRKLLPF